MKAELGSTKEGPALKLCPIWTEFQIQGQPSQERPVRWDQGTRIANGRESCHSQECSVKSRGGLNFSSALGFQCKDLEKRFSNVPDWPRSLGTSTSLRLRLRLGMPPSETSLGHVHFNIGTFLLGVCTVVTAGLRGEPVAALSNPRSISHC